MSPADLTRLLTVLVSGPIYEDPERPGSRFLATGVDERGDILLTRMDRKESHPSTVGTMESLTFIGWKR